MKTKLMNKIFRVIDTEDYDVDDLPIMRRRIRRYYLFGLLIYMKMWIHTYSYGWVQVYEGIRTKE